MVGTENVGTKTVTLEVTDAQDRTATTVKNVYVTAAPAPAPPAPTPAPDSGAVGCDSSVNTYAGLQAALGSTSSSGRTVCVTASLTGSKITTGTDMSARARVLAPPADGTVDIPSVTFNGASNITIEGFEFTGNRNVDVGGGSAGIHLLKNRCHDQALNCVMLGSSSGTSISGNRIERISYDGAYPHGYGVYGNTATTGLRVNYNLCDMGEIPSGDCFELGRMNDFEVIGNDIRNLNGAGGAAHADAIMVWNNSSNGVIKDNRVTDAASVLLSPDTDDLLIENNLIVRSENRCIDASPNGTSGQIAPLRWTWRNNTSGRAATRRSRKAARRPAAAETRSTTTSSRTAGLRACPRRAATSAARALASPARLRAGCRCGARSTTSRRASRVVIRTPATTRRPSGRAPAVRDDRARRRRPHRSTFLSILTAVSPVLGGTPPSGGAAPQKHDGQRAREDLHVRPHATAAHVFEVQRDHLLDAELAATADLPKPGDAGLDGEAAEPRGPVVLDLVVERRFGRGPSDMSPRSTFQICGSSSRLVRRRNRPTRVTRSSCVSLYIEPSLAPSLSR